MYSNGCFHIQSLHPSFISIEKTEKIQNAFNKFIFIKLSIYFLLPMISDAQSMNVPILSQFCPNFVPIHPYLRPKQILHSIHLEKTTNKLLQPISTFTQQLLFSK